MSKKLKPCPFCGSEAKVFSSSLNGYEVFCVACTGNAAENQDWLSYERDDICSVNPCTLNYISPDVAIDNWNYRAKKPITTKKLKSCPFCGSEVHLYSCEDGMYVITCNECGCGSLVSDNKNEVINTWNRRTQ